jgi:hypothetical protein
MNKEVPSLFEMEPAGKEPVKDIENLNPHTGNVSAEYKPSNITTPKDPKPKTIENLHRVIAADTEEIEGDLERHDNGAANSNAPLERGRVLGVRPNSAQAPGTPETQAEKDERNSDLRKLGPAGQRIADKKTPDYFPYNQIPGSN